MILPFLLLQLLCQFEPNSVIKFLETFDSYRVEHCLRLCQEYGIVDASAFLLERVGDVGSALLLTLSSLNDKFRELETAVGSVVSKVSLGGSASLEQHFSSVLKMEKVCSVYLLDCGNKVNIFYFIVCWTTAYLDVFSDLH